MLKKALLIGIWMTIAHMMSGQDIHYSQFFNSPLNLNPALTGIYNGDARLHANYKNQWSGVPVNYSSADLGADLKLRLENPKHFLGYGALVNYDRAGDLGLGWTGGNLFLSYSRRIGERSLLTPGITGGYYQRGFDQGSATSGSQWDGKNIVQGSNGEVIASNSISFLDLGIGLNYRWQKEYRKFLDLGVSLSHLNKPAQKFASDKNYEVPRPQKLNLYGMLNYKLIDAVDLLVNVLYSKQDVYDEILLNGQAKIYLGENQDKALYLGIGGRYHDAWYPMIGLELGQFYGAFSYDLNTSPWDIASDGRGGPELALRYIWSKVPDSLYMPCLVY